MPTTKMPKPIKRPTSENYWIRKKVPLALRPLVGKSEIWATLGTKDERQANIKIGAANAAIEAEWTRLRAEASRASNSSELFEPEPFKLTHQDLHALRREVHTRIRDHWMQEPPTGFGKLRLMAADEESLQLDAIDLLESGGYSASPANVERLVPLLIRARKEATSDLEHARVGEYEKITDLTKIPARTTPALDFVAAFEDAFWSTLPVRVLGLEAADLQPHIVSRLPKDDRPSRPTRLGVSVACGWPGRSVSSVQSDLVFWALRRGAIKPPIRRRQSPNLNPEGCNDHYRKPGAAVDF